MNATLAFELFASPYTADYRMAERRRRKEAIEDWAKHVRGEMVNDYHMEQLWEVGL